MALSLPGERSVAAATPAHPVRAILAWIANAKAARARRTVLQGLLDLDSARLRDLGISRDDIHAAIEASGSQSSGLILSAARARSARR